MEKVSNSMRKHVVICGKINSGKSTIFNALTGQQNAVVSPLAGTTTDPVSKAMELIPFGPIVLVDTAGTGDKTALGKERMKKTDDALRRADFVVYALSVSNFDESNYAEFLKKNIPHILVLNTFSKECEKECKAIIDKYKNAVVFINEEKSAETLRLNLSEKLTKLAKEKETFIGDLLKSGSTAVLVMPIDSAAPKGRLILPQVQIIRDCLDNGITAVCCQTEQLAETLDKMSKVDLVITDSQAFAQVNKIVPQSIPLTSFSILMARQKGDIEELINGANAIGDLQDGDKILMLEGCTHNSTHEDIGRVKIPALLKNKTGKSLGFEFFSGYQFPENLDEYKMAIQCGGCMLNSAEIKSRAEKMRAEGIPATNYGVCLAILSGAWQRCESFLRGEIHEYTANEQSAACKTDCR